MDSKSFDLLKNIPDKSKDEIFETILEKKDIKIERIISYGQTTAKDYWYDQDQDEFVLILKGKAKIKYELGEIIQLDEGSSIYIKAHEKHQVIYTTNPTIWLAIFFNT